MVVHSTIRLSSIKAAELRETVGLHGDVKILRLDSNRLLLLGPVAVRGEYLCEGSPYTCYCDGCCLYLQCFELFIWSLHVSSVMNIWNKTKPTVLNFFFLLNRFSWSWALTFSTWISSACKTSWPASADILLHSPTNRRSQMKGRPRGHRLRFGSV